MSTGSLVRIIEPGTLSASSTTTTSVVLSTALFRLRRLRARRTHDTRRARQLRIELRPTSFYPATRSCGVVKTNPAYVAPGGKCLVLMLTTYLAGIATRSARFET